MRSPSESDDLSLWSLVWSLFILMAGSVMGYVWWAERKIRQLQEAVDGIAEEHVRRAAELDVRCEMCGAPAVAVSYSRIGDDAKEISLCEECLIEAKTYHEIYFHRGE